MVVLLFAVFFFNILFLFCVLFCVCVFFLYFRFGIQRCVSVSYSRVSVLGLGFPFWLALDQKNNNGLFVRASRFLYISLPSLHDYDVKLPNFTSYGRREHKDNDFSWTSIKSFRMQLQNNLPTFDQLNEME